MKVFGLEMEQHHAELFISAMTAYSPGAFSEALADCSTEDTKTLEMILGEYYRNTEILREKGASNPNREATAGFFSAAAAPVINLLSPRLMNQGISIGNSILLAQFSYGDRRFAPSISAARGYMVERLITQGNTWDTPMPKYLWLGDRYQQIATIAHELEARNSVEESLVKELLRSTAPMVSGSL